MLLKLFCGLNNHGFLELVEKHIVGCQNRNVLVMYDTQILRRPYQSIFLYMPWIPNDPFLSFSWLTFWPNRFKVWLFKPACLMFSDRGLRSQHGEVKLQLVRWHVGLWTVPGKYMISETNMIHERTLKEKLLIMTLYWWTVSSQVVMLCCRVPLMWCLGEIDQQKLGTKRFPGVGDGLAKRQRIANIHFGYCKCVRLFFTEHNPVFVGCGLVSEFQ